jgi:hypothetical protein
MPESFRKNNFDFRLMVLLTQVLINMIFPYEFLQTMG